MITESSSQNMLMSQFNLAVLYVPHIRGGGHIDFGMDSIGIGVRLSLALASV